MSYEKQLASEQLKKRMYDLAAEKPTTRKQFIKELNAGKHVIANHVARMVAQRYLTISPIKALESGPQRSKHVSQYVANPRKPFEPKDPTKLAKETVQRFSLGKNKEKPMTPSANVHVYNLLDNPLPKAPRKDKKTIIGIGSSFNLVGW